MLFLPTSKIKGKDFKFVPARGIEIFGTITSTVVDGENVRLYTDGVRVLATCPREGLWWICPKQRTMTIFLPREGVIYLYGVT